MDKIAIGKIRTSTGVKGYLKVLSFSGEYKHFSKLKGLEIEMKYSGKTKFFSVEDVKCSTASAAIKLQGIDNPEDGKKLSGWEIYTERKYAAGLKKGEFYHADLHGCSLVYDKEPVGLIKGIVESPTADMLEVDTDGSIHLVPLLDVFIGEIDIRNKTIELKEKWLLE